MYPSDFKLDKSSPISKASPEHEEGKTITEDDEHRKKYVIENFAKYMNESVTPGLVWKCERKNDNRIYISTFYDLIEFRVTDKLSTLYFNLKEYIDKGSNEQIKYTGLEIVCLGTISTVFLKKETVKIKYKIDEFENNFDILTLKNDLMNSFPKEFIYKNWYFLKANAILNREKRELYFCLNNGGLYVIDSLSENNNLQCLFPIRIVSSLGEFKCYCEGISYRDGNFYNDGKPTPVEKSQEYIKNTFEKIVHVEQAPLASLMPNGLKFGINKH